MSTPLTSFGPWAVVTGASSGIGVEFARQLAAAGIHLVLVARREVEMKELADELERRHDIETRVVVADLAEGDFLDVVRRTTDDLDVGLVVSNAGAAAAGAMLRVPIETLRRMLALNTDAHLQLAHHFGGRFVARSRGGILLIGSTAGLQGTPLLGNYAGSKAYIHTLGQALNHELRKADVSVSVVAPGPTRTPALTDRTDVDMNSLPAPVMSVEKFVRVALKALRKNRPFTVAGAPNKTMDVMGRRVLGRRGSRAMWGALMEKATPDELKVLEVR